MKLKVSAFHGSMGKKAPTDLVLTHLSTSKNAAAERIESLFTGQAYTAIKHDGGMELIDRNGKTTARRSMSEHIKRFCDYLKGCQIHEFEFEVFSA